MSNSFCKNISNTYRFNHNNQSILHYQPCCWVPFNEPISNKESLVNAQQHISKEILKNTNRNCNECIQREKTNYRISGRLDADRYIPTDAVDGDAYILEFQLDTECNAACSICGPQFSSLWQKQLNIPLSKKETTQLMHQQINKLVSLDKVKQIKFFGGEPLLTESHLAILNQVPYPDQCDLMYSTNGSIFPSDDVIKVWKKFKKIKLSLSIDDIKERFEYIRWPLKWSRVESNLINIAQNISNIELRIHCTVNPINARYILELEQWITTIQHENNIKIEYSYSPCFGTWGIASTPPGLRDDLLMQYPSDHPVIGILNSFSQQDNAYQLLLNNMEELDNTRKLDWRKTFPLVTKYFY